MLFTISLSLSFSRSLFLSLSLSLFFSLSLSSFTISEFSWIWWGTQPCTGYVTVTFHEKKNGIDEESKAQKANDASLGILNKFRTSNIISTFSSFSNFKFGPPSWFNDKILNYINIRKTGNTGTDGWTIRWTDRQSYPDTKTHLKGSFEIS